MEKNIRKIEVELRQEENNLNELNKWFFNLSLSEKKIQEKIYMKYYKIQNKIVIDLKYKLREYKLTCDYCHKFVRHDFSFDEIEKIFYYCSEECYNCDNEPSDSENEDFISESDERDL